MFMATAKKVVRKVKEVAKKVAKKVTKKKVVQTEIVFVSCGTCNGSGLKDSHALCGSCNGNGTVVA